MTNKSNKRQLQILFYFIKLRLTKFKIIFFITVWTLWTLWNFLTFLNWTYSKFYCIKNIQKVLYLKLKIYKNQLKIFFYVFKVWANVKIFSFSWPAIDFWFSKVYPKIYSNDYYTKKLKIIFYLYCWNFMYIGSKPFLLII